MIVVSIGDIFIIMMVIIIGLIWLVDRCSLTVKQARCKHGDGVYEDLSCTAWCRTCGKNLGFIGDYRKKYVDKNGSR